jgi:hypothetical protein
VEGRSGRDDWRINFAKEYTPAVGLAAARAIAYSGFIDDDAIRGVYTVNGTTSHLFALYHVLALDPDVAAKKARAARPSAARAHLELAVSLLTLPLRWPAVARRAKLAERVRAMMGA